MKKIDHTKVVLTQKEQLIEFMALAMCFLMILACILKVVFI